MTYRYKKQFAAFSFFLLFVAAWGLLVYQFPPQGIVETLGIRNGYLVAFIAGFLGGISTFTSIPYTIVVVTLGVGGLHPVWLGVLAALGLFFGDSTSYVLGYYGHHVVPNGLQGRFLRLRVWLLARKRAGVVPIFIFLYGAFFPFSNDLVVISLGLVRYPFWRVMIPLGIGSIIYNTLLAYLGAYSAGYFL